MQLFWGTPAEPRGTMDMALADLVEVVGRSMTWEQFQDRWDMRYGESVVHDEAARRILGLRDDRVRWLVAQGIASRAAIVSEPLHTPGCDLDWECIGRVLPYIWLWRGEASPLGLRVDEYTRRHGVSRRWVYAQAQRGALRTMRAADIAYVPAPDCDAAPERKAAGRPRVTRPRTPAEQLLAWLRGEEGAAAPATVPMAAASKVLGSKTLGVLAALHPAPAEESGTVDLERLRRAVGEEQLRALWSRMRPRLASVRND